MNATRQIPVLGPDAGSPEALADPTSSASIVKKAMEQESQAGADTKFDPPPVSESFLSYIGRRAILETNDVLILSMGILLVFYALAPNRKLIGIR